MKTMTASTRILAALLLVAPAALRAQDVPIRNWEVPRDGLSKLALVQPAIFSAVSPPCRLSDSRVSSGGPGPIPASGTRDYDFVPTSAGCGTLPPYVAALSIFVTVVGPTGPGFLYAFPTGAPPGSPTSIVNYNAGELKNAAAVVPLDYASGSFTIGVGGAATDVIIDLNGVYINHMLAGQQLSLYTASPGGHAILGENQAVEDHSTGVFGHATGSGLVNGVWGLVNLSGPFGSAGVKGVNYGAGHGVVGTANSGWGSWALRPRASG